MKKYTSGAFVSTTYGIYKAAMDTITSFPASIIANGGNITPWAIYGNTVNGASVGEKTANLFDKDNTTIYNAYLSIDSESSIWITQSDSKSIKIPCQPNTQYTLSLSSEIPIFRISASSNADIEPSGIGVRVRTIIRSENISEYTFTTAIDDACIIFQGSASLVNQWLGSLMFNTGSTFLPYEPYGYKLPVVIGSNTTNIYMADVLRKSSGADPVYDIMSSTGIITRNVDTDGTPLVTPTTESFTAPTLATVAGSQSVSFDTTVKPSKAELTYTGWHTHTDKKYSGGSWGTVTSNAKKKKSLLGSRKTTKGKT